MKVIAVAMGFYDGRRIRAGTEFEVPQGSKASWYVSTEAVKAQAPKAKVQQTQALSEVGKEAAKSMTDVLANTDLA